MSPGGKVCYAAKWYCDKQGPIRGNVLVSVDSPVPTIFKLIFVWLLNVNLFRKFKLLGVCFTKECLKLIDAFLQHLKNFLLARLYFWEVIICAIFEP